MLRNALLISLLLATAGTLHAADTADRAPRLNALYAQFWEDYLKLNPVNATFAGDPRYNAEMPNILSKEFEQRRHDLERKYLDAARAIGAEGLTGQDRLSYEIFTLNRESELEDLKYPRAPCDHQFYNIANPRASRFRQGAQPFKTVRTTILAVAAPARVLRSSIRPSSTCALRQQEHRPAARTHGEGAAAARREHRR